MINEVTSYCFMNYIFIVGLIVGTNVVTCVEIKIEAETMSGSVGEISKRSTASSERSVHLYSGQSLYKDICLLSPTEISGVEVVYSNDGDADRVQVALGNVVLGEMVTMRYTNAGQGWSRFRPSSQTFTPITTVGRQSLKLTIIQSDSYGVEIDFIKFNINTSLSLESLKCEVFCFQDIEYTHDGDLAGPRGRAEQMSVKTACAEEDNVNVPIFHDNPQKFVVTAHMPKYSSFLNSRGPDWKNCDFYDAVWSFKNLHLISSRILTSDNDNAQLTMSLSSGQLLGSTRIAMMEIDFVLGNVTFGSTESVLGTVTTLTGLKFSGSVSFQFQYYDRYDQWSTTQIKTVDHGDTSVEFDTPDHSFREGGGNKVRIEVFTDHASVNDVIIGEMTMRMRQLAHDKSRQLFKDQQTVVEGVDMDGWWRVNESMTVTVNNATFSDIHYVRVYQREPWSDLRVSQVFVLYQDGNVRLLPLTPHGLDWIPFGSSVIIGQTDPSSPRPSAAINHVDIDPYTLKVTVWYKDGSVVPLEIKTTGPETQLIVSDSHFVGDLQTQPFFTFRSMYVTYGNCDVDHVSVDGGQAISILDHWSTLYGNFFAFFRKCISKHNTQSPDITIAILP